ncbi:MAG: hypothetical protein M3083_01780 [Actinomycetota bacterium]|nr:hypothetical protein [Actinomycetota bacterium]
MSVTSVVALALAVNTTGQAAAAAGWIPAASMAGTRTQHAAARLADGKVLVVGGRVGSGNSGPNVFVDTAEVYNPATDSWSSAGTPQFGARPTATTLGNGRVLVAGGSHQNGPCPGADCVDSKAALYDEGTNTFLPTAAMSEQRDFHTATLLADGRVLVAGGEPNELLVSGTAEIYNPNTNLWSTTGSMSTPRIGHTATRLADGTVLVTGGSASNGIEGLASAEVYDPSTGTWSPASSMAVARFGAAATLLGNGKVLVAGGVVGGQMLDGLASAELYDPASRTFSPAGTMSAGRVSLTANLLPDGHVLAAGGYSGRAGGNNSPLKSAELYNPATNTWAATAAMGTARAEHAATSLVNGDVLVTGGSPGTATAERYRATVPTTTTTRPTTTVPAHRCNPPNGRISGPLYRLGRLFGLPRLLQLAASLCGRGL